MGNIEQKKRNYFDLYISCIQNIVQTRLLSATIIDSINHDNSPKTPLIFPPIVKKFLDSLDFIKHQSVKIKLEFDNGSQKDIDLSPFQLKPPDSLRLFFTFVNLAIINQDLLYDRIVNKRKHSNSESITELFHEGIFLDDSEESNFTIEEFESKYGSNFDLFDKGKIESIFNMEQLNFILMKNYQIPRLILYQELVFLFSILELFMDESYIMYSKFHDESRLPKWNTYKKKSLMKRIKLYQKYNLINNYSEAFFDELTEARARRNLITHKGAKTTKQYNKRFNKNYPLNKPTPINSDYLEKIAVNIILILDNLFKNILEMD